MLVGVNASESRGFGGFSRRVLDDLRGCWEVLWTRTNPGAG